MIFRAIKHVMNGVGSRNPIFGPDKSASRNGHAYENKKQPPERVAPIAQAECSDTDFDTARSTARRQTAHQKSQPNGTMDSYASKQIRGMFFMQLVKNKL